MSKYSRCQENMAYHLDGMEWELLNIRDYRQPKKPTILDHLTDCFGWLI